MSPRRKCTRPLRNPVDEAHPLSARSPYGAAKIGAEKLVEAYANAFGLRAAVLRPFSIFGPRASPASLIPRIVSCARRGVPIALHDLRPVRDYTFVEDFAHAVVCACEGSAEGVFNVGSGEGRSVAQVAEEILRILGVRLGIVEQRAEARPGQCEILELVAGVARARELLGWAPQTSFEEGLRRTISQ